jgi:PiT family inorganic phosphate transporter
MMTVGSTIYKLNPITAFIVVLSSSIVLFLFASQGLKDLLISHGLPSFPLVPVSSSQSIVGGVIGIGLAKGGRNINLSILGKISLGWIATPVISALISYFALFVVQNVFGQVVF